MPRFSPGEVVITPSALAAFFRNRAEPQEYLDRHLSGDWGTVSAVDAAENEYSIKQAFVSSAAIRCLTARASG